MYANTAMIETLNLHPRTTALKSIPTRMPQSVTTTRTTQTRTDVDISAWARHARGANGFGDGAID